MNGAGVTEKAFMQTVIDAARLAGWLVYHPFDSRRSEPGYPDLTLVHPERGLVFAELKTARGRLSAAQVRWLTAIGQAGARAYVWRPDDWPRIAAVLNGDMP